MRPRIRLRDGRISTSPIRNAVCLSSSLMAEIEKVLVVCGHTDDDLFLYEKLNRPCYFSIRIQLDRRITGADAVRRGTVIRRPDSFGCIGRWSVFWYSTTISRSMRFLDWRSHWNQAANPNTVCPAQRG